MGRCAPVECMLPYAVEKGAKGAGAHIAYVRTSYMFVHLFAVLLSLYFCSVTLKCFLTLSGSGSGSVDVHACTRKKFVAVRF